MLFGKLFNLQDDTIYNTINSYLTEELFLSIITLSVLIDAFYTLQPSYKKYTDGYKSYYHLYYYIVMSMFLTSENILLHSVIFFGLDFIIQILTKSLTLENAIKNIIKFTGLLLINKQELLIFSEAYSIQNITSIISVLYSLDLLDDNLFNLLFSFTYVIARLILFNYKLITILYTVKLFNSSWVVELSDDSPRLISYEGSFFIIAQNISNIYMTITFILDKYTTIKEKVIKLKNE